MQSRVFVHRAICLLHMPDDPTRECALPSPAPPSREFGTWLAHHARLILKSKARGDHRGSRDQDTRLRPEGTDNVAQPSVLRRSTQMTSWRIKMVGVGKDCATTPSIYLFAVKRLLRRDCSGQKRWRSSPVSTTQLFTVHCIAAHCDHQVVSTSVAAAIGDASRSSRLDGRFQPTGRRGPPPVLLPDRRKSQRGARSRIAVAKRFGVRPMAAQETVPTTTRRSIFGRTALRQVSGE